MGSGRRAAMYGKKVLMIENRRIGGTCVNVGCVPKKVMYNLANFIEESHLFKDYGVEGTEQLKLNFADFKAQRDAYVTRLNGIYSKNLENSKVDYVPGTAKFVSDKIVDVEGKLFTAEHILIASGSTPEPGKPKDGSDLCINSDHFFEMSELPKSMICIGGGYIGVEMAQIMAALGVKVTLVTRGVILKHIDRDIIQELMNNMKKLGVEIILNAPHKRIHKEPNGTLTLSLDVAEGKDKVNADKILLAVGRPPNVDSLCLDKTQIKHQKGFITVDEFQNTTVKGVYAIGDVTNNGWALTPVAIRSGRILAERIFNNKPNLKMLYENIPTVIFSHPPIGTVGLSEEEAKKKFGETNVVAYRSSFVNMFYSPAKDPNLKLSSLFKVICLKKGEGPANEKVVGCVGIGKGMDEMLQGLSIALTMGASK